MKVSIIIPTYNAGRKIVRALHSVWQQTAWRKGHIYEMLICDDGSTDNTLLFCRQFPNVRILASEHNTGGPNAGRNRGIQGATGDVIAFLDQDDEWLPDKIEYQLGLMEKYNQDLIYSSHIYRGCSFGEQPDMDIHERLLRLDFSAGAMYPSSILVRNENVPLAADRLTDYRWAVSLTEDRRCMRSIPKVYRREVGLSTSIRYKIDDCKAKLAIITYPPARRKVYGTLGRCLYVNGYLRDARRNFMRSGLSPMNVIYMLSSFRPQLARRIARIYESKINL